nr:MAG TPA: hypothetical protein [Bacteriophage sp.]
MVFSCSILYIVVQHVVKCTILRLELLFDIKWR